MIDVYLCLGSNAPNARDCLARAIQALSSLEQCTLLATSSIYLTEPQNYTNQPWFHNQVIKMGCSETLSPATLMEDCLAIETAQGRKRDGPRFGPRQIDIDLLLYGGLVSSDPFCILPHPRLIERAFALVPLLELAPEIEIFGQSAKSWLARLDWRLEKDKIFQ